MNGWKIKKEKLNFQLGFYAQINSPEDAKARVVDYALVMARPMVLYQADHPIHWSPVFLGGSSGNIGYVNERQRRLVTTVSTPVFDRRNHSVREANLLGVVGADVSIEEIVKMIPQYKVSENDSNRVFRCTRSTSGRFDCVI